VVAGTTSSRGTLAFPAAPGASRPPGTVARVFVSSKMGRRKNEKSS